MISLKSEASVKNSIWPLFSLGFRPFFLGAALFAVLSVAVWMVSYVFGAQLPLLGLPAMLWHGHEMIYGYSMAVIAGFLLTAVANWTKIPTPSGYRLALLVAPWALARVLPWVGGREWVAVAALCDLAFTVFLLYEVTRPIVIRKQWKQVAIIAKVMFLGAFNAAFYLAVLWEDGAWMRISLYAGLYVIVGLILTMARRIMPGFIERGVGYEVKLPNPRWLDVASLILYVAFFIVAVFLPNDLIAGSLAMALFALHAVRLWGWNTRGVWRNSLLWSLYVAYAFIVLGFLLYALTPLGIFPFLSTHAFAYGGIGLITLSMMARVSLGHSGRDVRLPHPLIGYAFAVLVAGTVLRVILPLFDPASYVLWIACSQALWMLAFVGFLIVFFPALIKPDIHGVFPVKSR